MTRATTTRGGSKKQAAVKRRAAPRREDGVVELDRTQPCWLLCFDPSLPEELPWAAVVSVLAQARKVGGAQPPWVVHAGTSPLHWRGLTHWLLINEAVPPKVYERLCDELRAAPGLGDFESTELTTPEREPFVRPLFCVDDEGASLLMEPERVDPTWRDELAGVPLTQRGWSWAASARRRG